MECQYESVCENFGKSCFRCFEGCCLKLKKGKSSSHMGKKIVDKQFNYKEANKKNSWEDLEQTVTDQLNDIPTIAEARRTRASGALWFEKGDIKDIILHPECKERTGTELKSGGKSITLKKEWLEKAREECKFEQTFMCLPFRFKGDDSIYVIMENNDLMELVTMMKAYMQDNELKEAIIQKLKKQLEEQNH